MRLAENVRFALAPLKRRPIRSFLLLQGTIWGVAVSLFPAAVLEGSRKNLLARSTAVGADRVTIAADPTTVEPRVLARDDVSAIRAAFGGAGIRLIASA